MGDRRPGRVGGDRTLALNAADEQQDRITQRMGKDVRTRILMECSERKRDELHVIFIV